MVEAEATAMLKIELVKFGDLTDEEKEEQPNNGCGKENARYIKLSNAGRTLMIISDAVEPEDATFTRDFRKVINAIQLAYKCGISDGKKLRG
jgi:hypothetical protein